MLNNCFNYVGSKDKIFPAIDKNLDKSKSIFVDVFCGSGVVGVNEIPCFNKVILNDACWQMMKTLEYFKNTSYNDIIADIKNVISAFKLSKENKEGYLDLREFYNENYNLPENFSPVHFYCLLTHSFNYNIHINKSGGFSVPFGAHKSYFNKSLENKLKNFQEELYNSKEKVCIENKNFIDLFKAHVDVMQNTMFYCDPPYLSSDSSYGRIYYLGRWNQHNEKDLYNCLDYVNMAGGSFLLSNVIENNGKINDVLYAWSKKYNVIDVSSDYTNCNYQRKNAGKTKEVLVRNY